MLTGYLELGRQTTEGEKNKPFSSFNRQCMYPRMYVYFIKAKLAK